MAGYIKLIRGEETTALFRDRNAFILLAAIAYRARRTDDPVSDLKVGEAQIGDVKNYGLTQQEYRTAKRKLKKWGFATFKATSKGTIAKLANTRIYDINLADGNEQPNEQPTSKQRAANEQLTTNKNVRMEECKKSAIGNTAHKDPSNLSVDSRERPQNRRLSKESLFEADYFSRRLDETLVAMSKRDRAAFANLKLQMSEHAQTINPRIFAAGTAIIAKAEENQAVKKRAAYITRCIKNQIADDIAKAAAD